MDLPSNAPAQPQDLASWATAGWVIEFVHGNSDRGGYIRLRKGALVNQAQALLGIGKDGKKFYVAARLVWGADPPDDWKDPQNWLQAGWTITDATGNLEHGAFLILTKSIDASAQ